MRDAILVVAFLIIAIQTLRVPHAGVLGWTWFALMTPQRMAWTYAEDFQFNLILVVITLLALTISRDRKFPHWNLLMLIWLLFVVDITLTSAFSLTPDLTWTRWEKAIKIMALGILIPLTITSKERIHALILVIVISLAYFGIKGGVFTLLTGGGLHVLGPPDSELGDNNNLALALCLTLPLLNYVRIQSSARAVRVATTIAMVLVAVAVLGTYSRGGLVGLAIMGAYFLWKSKQRLTITALVLMGSFVAFQLMPQSWQERMWTIQTAQQDASFQERLDAWQVAQNIAAARPLLGSGLGASEDAKIYLKYIPANSIYFQNGGRPESGFTGRAYHSIYFQVLGDNGYPGLLLFVALLLLTWRQLSQVRRTTRDVPEQLWAFDLATMMQISIVSYAVAGAALSMAYYDMPYIFVGIAIAMREIVLARAGSEPGSVVDGELVRSAVNGAS